MIQVFQKKVVLGILAMVFCGLSGCNLPVYQAEEEPPFWHYDPDQSAPVPPPSMPNLTTPSFSEGETGWSPFSGKPMSMPSMNGGGGAATSAMPSMSPMHMGEANVVHGPAEVSGFGNHVNVMGDISASSTRVSGSRNSVNVFAGKK